MENQTNQKPDQENGAGKPIKKPRRFTYQSGSTVLSGYTIKRGIGIGGFGEVYFAISDAGKEVALKRIQRNLDVEIRGVSQCLNLKHINLISLWDIRQDTEGESWVVMEYVPGESLREILERNPNGISASEARDWFLGILDGVSYLHDHGIVHRDLKPGNVFYDQDEKVVKIGDYGLSKFISTSRRDGQTESVGTFHYMAPEIGKGSYGKEIDIYSLGIILCEILSGKVPFEGESGQEIIMKHLTATPELAFLPYRFRQVIEKALSKDPVNRFSSVQQMIDALNWDENPENKPNKVPFNETIQEPAVESMLIPHELRADTTDGEIKPGKVTERTGRSESTTHENSSTRMSGRIWPPESPQTQEQVSGSSAESRDSQILQTDVPSQDQKQDVPITDVMATGYPSIPEQWDGIGGTMVKVVLIVLLALVVLFNAQWLVPACIILGCVYMVYYALWSNVASKNSLAAKAGATVFRPFSRKEVLTLVEQKLREDRSGLPFSEKLAETMGSLLLAALVISVSVLVSIGFSGFSLDGSPATLSLFAWISLTSWLAAASSIFFTKILESSTANQWKRRFFLMTSGMLVGAASHGIYQHFLIETILLPPQMTNLVNLTWIAEGKAGLMRFMTFFAGIFLVIRWWKVGDPLRTSQLSIFYLVLHAILGVGMALAASFPVSWGLIISGTMSLAIQMSSTWIGTTDRERIQTELMQSPAS